MAEKIEWMIGPREPGSMQGILPGESLDDFEKRVGDDAPEWTDEDFSRARPMIEVFPEIVEAFEKMRRARDAEKQEPTNILAEHIKRNS